MNAVAFKMHGNDADLETMAKNLRTTGGRLLPTLRRPEAAGWITVEGESLAFVGRIEPLLDIPWLSTKHLGQQFRCVSSFTIRPGRACGRLLRRA